MSLYACSDGGNAVLCGQCETGGGKDADQQLARKYILKMETEGRLTDADRTTLCQELESLGVTGVDLGGSTLEKAGYGEAIVLVIRGRLRDGYEFEEKRVSVAKH